MDSPSNFIHFQVSTSLNIAVAKFDISVCLITLFLDSDFCSDLHLITRTSLLVDRFSVWSLPSLYLHFNLHLDPRENDINVEKEGHCDMNIWVPPKLLSSNVIVFRGKTFESR